MCNDATQGLDYKLSPVIKLLHDFVFVVCMSVVSDVSDRFTVSFIVFVSIYIYDGGPFFFHHSCR